MLKLPPIGDLHCQTLARMARQVTATAAVTAMLAISLPAHADGPGRGITAAFEQDYLKMVIDHHFSALRITELAAGTDVQRDAPVDNKEEGTSPTPNTTATPPKAGMDEIKSMARAANRMQREEIMEAQKMLKDWYGTNHAPQLTPEGQQRIQLLEQTPGGPQFEQAFLQTFSSHHYRILFPSLDCQVKSDLEHDKLRHYCDGIVHNQTREINEMRRMLCKQFAICDFQPTTGLRGQYTGAK